MRVSLLLTHEKHPHQEQQHSQLTLVIWESNPIHFHAAHRIQDAPFLFHEKSIGVNCLLLFGRCASTIASALVLGSARDDDMADFHSSASFAKQCFVADQRTMHVERKSA